jgi:hypothetical protein
VSDGESLTFTQSLTPSKDSAPPFLSAVVQVAPEIAPPFPFREASAVFEPAPSPNA